MKRAIVCVVLAAFLGCAADEPPADTAGDTTVDKTAESAVDTTDDNAAEAAVDKANDDSLLAAGKSAVNSLTPLAAGARYESYFEVKSGPEDTVGYVIGALEAIRDKGQPVYQYTVEFVTSFAGKAQLIAIVNAKLKPNFEPIEIEMKRTTVRPDLGRRTVVRRAVIAAGKVALTAEAEGEHQTNEVPQPERPFIYGVEMLAQRLDFRKHDNFILREFDLSTGGAGPLTFATAEWGDGTPTVLTRNAGGVQSYQFWYDGEGKLMRWGEPSLPVIFVRTTKKRAMELKAKFAIPVAGDTD